MLLNLFYWIKNNKILTIIVIILVLKSFFFNRIIDIAIPPDIDYHKAVSNIYRKNPYVIFFWQRKNVNIDCQDNTIYSPAISTSPFLYHSLIGKIEFLVEKISPQNYYPITSWIQTWLGIINIIVVYYLILLINNNKFAAYIGLIIIGFLPMYSYQINYLSYDNLINLAGTLSIYYLIKYTKSHNTTIAIYFWIWIFIGMLSKITFAPLALILFILYLYEIKLRVIEEIKKIIKYHLTPNFCLNKIFFTCFLALNIIFFARNIFYYHQVYPDYKFEYERNCIIK